MISKYLSNLEDKYDKIVITYVKYLIETIMDNDFIVDYLDRHDISLDLLANNVLPLSQKKHQVFNYPDVTEFEINVILQNIKLNKEIERLIEEGHINIETIDPLGNLAYDMDDHAIDYFIDEWNASFRWTNGNNSD